MPISYDIPDSKKIRVILDTDAACEADDPFAIAHALLSRKLIVKAILAEHFAQRESTRKSYDEILLVLKAMNLDVPVFMGEEGPVREIGIDSLSPAASFLIDEAHREDEKPLFVLCMGAITNVASALRHDNDIAKKMTVVWIGGHSLDNTKPDHREFNSGNDVDAYNIVVSSGTEFWQIPNNVYGTMKIGIGEIQKRIAPCGEIGRHLFKNLVEYNNSPQAVWTQGESWSLGDSPSVGVAIDPDCGSYIYREAPVLRDDTSYKFERGRPRIRVYQSIDSRFVLEDFISKLQLTYGES